MAKELAIAVSDANAPFMSGFAVDGVWLDSAVRRDLDVTSVQDLVAKVLAKLAKHPGSSLRRLYINGHGSPGWQAVGAGQGNDATGDYSLQVDPATKQLKGKGATEMPRLVGQFSPNAVVTLSGCQVGSGTQGQELLKAVSAILGNVAVQAADKNQSAFPPGMEGNVTQCVGTSCTVVKGGLWGVPKQKAAAPAPVRHTNPSVGCRTGNWQPP